MLGRFLSVDTVQPNAPGSQGYNVYAYVANNPTTWVDPSGHAVFAVIGVALAANRLPITLALATVLIADCAAAFGTGQCPGMATFLITIFTIVNCLLQITGPCWTDNIVEYGKRLWSLPELRNLPNHRPDDPRKKCAIGAANGVLSGVPLHPGGIHELPDGTRVGYRVGTCGIPTLDVHTGSCGTNMKFKFVGR